MAYMSATARDQYKQNYLSNLRTAKVDITPVEASTIIAHMDKLFLSNRLPKIEPSSMYRELPHIWQALWANHNGIYSIPTDELVTFVRGKIGARSSHEIGSANSVLARYLKGSGMHCSDPRSQETTLIKALVNLTASNPPFTPSWVSHKNAKQVVEDYKPDVILAQWVTPGGMKNSGDQSGRNSYGPDYKDMLTKIEELIFVGNKDVHQEVMFGELGEPDEQIEGDWILSRAFIPDRNAIWIWKNKESK